MSFTDSVLSVDPTPGVNVTLDETTGLQNGAAADDDNDILVASLPSAFSARLTALGAGTATEAALSGYTGAAGNTGSNAFTITAAPGGGITDISFVGSTGAPLNGLDSGLDTLDGTDILLYTDTNNNIVLGRAGGSTGAIVFAAYIEETGSPVTGGKIWTVQYEPLKHPDITNHDDQVNLLNKVFIGASQDLEFSLAGAPSGQNLFLMFTKATPATEVVDGVTRITDPTIIATGKNPADQSSGANITTGDTINTSQAGGPTTFGTNNQMIVEQEGIRFSFVTGARQNVTIPNLDQNEADVESNIDFTGVVNTKVATFDVVQLQSGKSAVVKVSAFSTVVESGVNFINGYVGDTAIAITNVRVINISTGLVIENSNGSVNDPAILISFVGGVATITGVKAGYRIEYTTTLDHNRVLVENGAALDAKGNNHADFDIGGFKLLQASLATAEIGSKIIFDDDGPSADVIDGGGAVTIDETAGNQDSDNDAAAVLALFDTEVTNKGTDLNPTEFAISTTPLATTALSSFGQDQEGATKVLSLAIVGGDGTDSLLNTTDGKNILLFKEGDLIVGRYDVANGVVTVADPAAFAIALLQDGNVAVAQYVSLTHPIAGSTAAAHDDRVDLTGLINAVVTVTDGDGDTSTDSVDIGDDINFDDDGPAVSANNTVLLDDDALSGNPGGTGDDADSADVSGTLGHDFGQDGAGTVAYLTSGAPTGFTYVADGTSLLVKQGTTTVLTLTMVAATGVYTVEQNNPILHAAGLTENNQAFTINYRVTDGDGDTADGTLGINVDDDTPIVTAKSNLVYANGSNGGALTDLGGTGVFAYSIGADKHVAPYSASNSDFLSVALTGVTVGANAITNTSVSWVSETDGQAVFNVGFTYVSNNPAQGATTNATGTLIFDKVADTYTLKLAQEIESFSILNTSTPGNPLQGYVLDSDTTDDSNPQVSVMTLASNFFVQFEGFGVENETDQTFAYDTVTGLFSNDRRYVTVSSDSIGAASDTLQSDEVIDLDFYTENPKGVTNDPTLDRATSKAIFIEFTQAGPGAGKDMVVVLKLVDDITGTTINRTFIVGNSAGNDDIFNADLPAYGFVAQAQNGIVVFESNDYNFTGEHYSIQGAQVVTSTQLTSGTGFQLNGAIDDPATAGVEGATTNAQIAFGGDTAEGNNEPIKIVNIGFVSSTTPDAHLTFDVVLADADSDATTTQTLDVTIVGDNRVTASTGEDTFVIADTDVDGLLSMVSTVINGGFATGTDKLDFTTAGSGANYTEELAPATNLAAFTAAADTALNGTTNYYFGVVGGDGYLAFDGDGNGITSIIQLVGVTDIVSTDIV
ncbi:S-layer family protein [Pseudomonas sp. Irchel s3h17]|uniref:beta strand repeat-containing protein n=1 Tax=Pseudomonas sp. Irchel s3h17 TaxID=2009182 RepID=UPI002115A967|nr:DUF5801 repeats-in-toxin domain-containing protein [Pseudomonas sp. Irchel s3h17]